MKQKTENAIAIVLGLMMIIFGLNKFLGFIAVAPPDDPLAQQFLGTMFSTYLFVVVGAAEIIGGLFLLIPRFRFAGWLIQGVIIFNIVAFHLSHDFIGNGIWLVPAVLFLLLGYFQLPTLKSIFSVKPLRQIAPFLLLLFTVNVSAQSGNHISTKVENSIVLNLPAAKVWSFVSKVENFSLLVPEVIQKVEASGSGVYSSWVLYLQSDLWVKEEMTYFNPKEMELSYIMTKTPMPLSDYLAIQKVEPVDTNNSKVVFTTYFNSSAQNKEKLQQGFQNFQITFLNNIKKTIK